jgi:hypothetical protein
MQFLKVSRKINIALLSAGLCLQAGCQQPYVKEVPLNQNIGASNNPGPAQNQQGSTEFERVFEDYLRRVKEDNPYDRLRDLSTGMGPIITTGLLSFIAGFGNEPNLQINESIHNIDTVSAQDFSNKIKNHLTGMSYKALSEAFLDFRKRFENDLGNTFVYNEQNLFENTYINCDSKNIPNFDMKSDLAVNIDQALNHHLKVLTKKLKICGELNIGKLNDFFGMFVAENVDLTECAKIAVGKQSHLLIYGDSYNFSGTPIALSKMDEGVLRLIKGAEIK